jgi:NAD(P)-dependent dehydrogenase (short-subunit alcohol dehydrogenase family)
MLLQGRTAVITGGGQGLGEGMALRFAQEAADIAIIPADRLMRLPSAPDNLER